MISKGKRRYLIRVYASLVALHKFRAMFGMPVLSRPELQAINAKWADLWSLFNENSKKSMAEVMGQSEPYLVVEVPVRRQRAIEIDKSTGQPRHGLPMVTLFTEKGPTDVTYI